MLDISVSGFWWEHLLPEVICHAGICWLFSFEKLYKLALQHIPGVEACLFFHHLLVFLSANTNFHVPSLSYFPRSSGGVLVNCLLILLLVGFWELQRAASFYHLLVFTIWLYSKNELFLSSCSKITDCSWHFLPSQICSRALQPGVCQWCWFFIQSVFLLVAPWPWLLQWGGFEVVEHAGKGIS